MRQQNESDIGDLLLMAAVLTAGGVAGATYAGGWLAAKLQAPRDFVPSFGEALIAGSRLPSNMSDPKLAWPKQYHAALPGAVGYWIVNGLLLLIIVALAFVVLGGRFRRESLDNRKRLGAETQARMATKKDLRHVLIRKPDPNRLIIGRFKRHHVATETARVERGRGRRGRRSGGRSSGRGAVAHIGPSQSGKTTNVIGGVRHFGGPMILLSVKDDAMSLTIGRRRELGEVKIFDPTGVTGRGNAQWSPLRGTTDPHGALKAAKRLANTAPRSGSSDKADFWNTQAESLVTALMLLAANAEGKTMADVVRWVITMDMPRAKDQGEVAPLLRALKSSESTEVVAAAEFALNLLQGIWKGDERTTSSIYATARSMLWAWADPVVARSSMSTDIDLAWLLGGNNTLYLSAPLSDHQRVAPVLSGLLADLVDQLFMLNVQTGKVLDPPLLVVVDEAANTKLQDLPEWAATLSGLGVQLVTVWQSVAQIEAVYGAQTDAIITNHPTKIFYPGMSDIRGLETASALMGQEHLPGRLGSSEVRPEQASPTQVPFASPATIRQMRPGTGLMITATSPPAMIEISPP